MSRVFTDYLRHLDGRGEPSDDHRFEAVWRALRRALCRELHRRGLWQSSPAYLGIVGWQRWQEPVDDQGALEELLADCYSYIFCQRLRSLEAQRQIKANVDGLVVRNVRNFVHDRQRSHDPVGLRIYEVLREAVEESLSAGILQRIGSESRLRSRSRLGFAARQARLQAGDHDLGRTVRAWNDTLMPALVLARGRRRAQVVARLRACLESLSEQGIERFRFGDVLEPLRYDVRARWAALLDQESATRRDSRWATLPQAATPGSSFEARQSFDALVHCVDRCLLARQANRRTRGYLASLWSFLRAHALSAAPAIEGRRDPDRLPSRRQLSRLLGIPRERLPGLFGILRPMIERCQGRTGSTAKAAADPAMAPEDKMARIPALPTAADRRPP